MKSQSEKPKLKLGNQRIYLYVTESVWTCVQA